MLRKIVILFISLSLCETAFSCSGRSFITTDTDSVRNTVSKKAHKSFKNTRKSMRKFLKKNSRAIGSGVGSGTLGSSDKSKSK